MRKTLVVYFCGVVVLLIGLATVLALGWWFPVPDNMPPLGSTAQQWETIFGAPFLSGSDMEYLHRQSRLYVMRGWWVIVSFDEAGHAEQFIFTKAKLHVVPALGMSTAEQEALVNRFNDGSTWARPVEITSGPLWKRTDQGAYGFYMPDWRTMTIMSNAGMKRAADALPKTKASE